MTAIREFPETEAPMKRSILHRVVYRTLIFLVRPYIRLKYTFTTDRVPRLNEPFLLLSNHTTEEDMLFTGTACKEHMYFVCGEHLLRNRLYGKPLRVLLDPIPVPKGGASIGAVREIVKRLKAGENICMFPEGKRSFHGETIPSSLALGKLVKMAGCALVTYRIRGGYFTYPRWARDHHRKGHIEGKVMGVYSSKELAGMTAGEVTDIINRDTYENAFETQREKMWPYKGTDKAKGLEHVLFLCPRCGGMDTIRTEGDRFFCRCGLEGVCNDYGFFEGKDLPFDNVLSWMRWIETEFDAFAAQHGAGEVLFSEPDVRLYRMMDHYRNEDLLMGTLSVSGEGMLIGAHSFRFRDISDLSILYGNIVLFTHEGIYYGLTGDTFHAWKCGRLWHLAKGDTADRTKEM